MDRYAAFLRAINVGGHTVAMPRLTALFQDVGLVEVSTFIASGNVFFTSDHASNAELEQQIEQHLQASLGYPVATFIRSRAAVLEIASAEPFADVDAQPGDGHYVALLRAAPDQAGRDRVLALAGEADLLRFEGSELHWLRRGSFLDATFKVPQVERAIGSVTVRNVNTVRRMAKRLA